VAVHDDGIAPDRFELWIRFGFGALFGAFMAGAWFVAFGPWKPLTGALITGGAALLGGLLARSFGDRFWYSLRSWLWLFWP